MAANPGAAASSRHITHTDHDATHPWPADIAIQGGRGWANRTDYHDEWFFEAFPANSFLRGTGPTLTDAETQAWQAWQRMQQCPAAPGHGPFEARTFTNGAGYCTRCGSWFSRVLPAQHHDIDHQAVAAAWYRGGIAALNTYLAGKGVGK